jgi:hypothetical protein
VRKISLQESKVRLRGQDYLYLRKTIAALQAICYKTNGATMMLDIRPRTIFDFEAITNPTYNMVYGDHPRSRRVWHPSLCNGQARGLLACS